MGTLFKAVIGFAIAFALLPQNAGWTPDFGPLRHDLAEVRPAEQLKAWLLPQTGTGGPEKRARHLQFPDPGVGQRTLGGR
jgi:hypothetical protein